MIRKFKKEDTTKVMSIWTKGNFKAHNFIEKDYWLLKYNQVKENLLKSETYVFVIDDEIKGFISISNKEVLESIFISKEFQRQGIGRNLINYCKEKYDQLKLCVYEKNIYATLFFVDMGFCNTKIHINPETKEKEYLMVWHK